MTQTVLWQARLPATQCGKIYVQVLKWYMRGRYAA
jgi:hypothetical protein